MNKGEIYKLSSAQSDRLLKEPESGMGYQILDIRGLNEPVNRLIVSNSKYIIDHDAFESSEVPIIKNYENFKFSKIDLPDEGFISSIGKQIKLELNHKFSKTTKKAQESLPQFGYKTKNGDEFRRLSAFKDDLRIGSNGSLIPGTYATSVSDLNVVPSGIAAVGRYALPNKVAACYIYQIIPPVGTLIYFGTVEPNYGLCGGGVEVYFPNGCSENSVRLIGTIPEI